MCGGREKGGGGEGERGATGGSRGGRGVGGGDMEHEVGREKIRTEKLFS